MAGDGGIVAAVAEQHTATMGPPHLVLGVSLGLAWWRSGGVVLCLPWLVTVGSLPQLKGTYGNDGTTAPFGSFTVGDMA